MSASEIRKHINLFESDQKTPEDREAMLKKDGMRLREISDPTLRECVIAIKQNKKAAWYVPLAMRNELERYYLNQSRYNSIRNLSLKQSLLPPGAFVPPQHNYLLHDQTDPFVEWNPNPEIGTIKTHQDENGRITGLKHTFEEKKNKYTDLSESDQKLTRLIRHVYQQNPKKLARMLREAIGDFDQKKYDYSTQSEMVKSNPLSVIEISNPIPMVLYQAIQTLSNQNNKHGLLELQSYFESTLEKLRIAGNKITNPEFQVDNKKECELMELLIKKIKSINGKSERSPELTKVDIENNRRDMQRRAEEDKRAMRSIIGNIMSPLSIFNGGWKWY